MIKTIKDFLKKYNLTTRETIILAGFSGGFDSSVLLDILFRLQQEFGFKLCTAHLNHGWRKEADSEENYCKNFCEDRNIPFYTEKLDNSVPKTETAAREARYEFFARAAKHFDTKIVLTAHTQSDNVETIIYRLARGTGISGLCGINEKHELNGLTVFRPMLNLTRADIEAYCCQNNLTPNNDSSNFDTKYKRNLIRQDILPLFTQINPEAASAINNLIENAKLEENIVNEYLGTIKKQIFKGNKVVTKQFLKLSKPVKQRIIYDFVQHEKLDYDQKKILNILDFISTASKFKTGKTLSLTDNLWLFCSEEEFYTIKNIEKKDIEPVKIKDFNKEYRFADYKFTIKKYDKENFTFPEETADYALVDLTSQCDLELRFRKNGDIIQPFGMPCTTKLKKYFINKNIPKHKKDSIVLLCNQNEVLWAHKVGLSEKLRAKNKPAYILKIEEVQNGN